MMENHNPEDFRHDDLLDRAVDAVLCEPSPDDLSPAEVARLVAVVQQAANQPYPIIMMDKMRNLKRIVKVALAVSILVVLGLLVSWLTIGSGSTNVVFADVGRALDNLRSATFDIAAEVKDPITGKTNTTLLKGFYLAPSRERIETVMSNDSARHTERSITIFDGRLAKGLVLMPKSKTATRLDASRMGEQTFDPSEPFRTVRQLVREGRTGSDVKVESLARGKSMGTWWLAFERTATWPT